MAVSVVNGYLCMCSCDVAKAKRGEDPHPNAHAQVGNTKRQGAAGGASRTDGPAVLWGGALSGPPASAVAPVEPGAATDAASPRTRKSGIDLLV